MLLIIECGLVLLALGWALICPRRGERWFEPVERGFARLARRRGLSVVVVGATALGLRLLLLPILPVPEPSVHDEFSYLLAADTFAHGRLTNPPHPMWVHFETFHEIQQPTYASMYYPAQGMFLALGQVVFGNPYWGVWLSAGLMCAAICWMLQGWVAAPWALLGGMLAVIRLGTFTYWMNSYWGGSVAALGGALVLGALPRMLRRRRTRDGLWLGLGLAIVANSRPYEGLFLAVPVMAGLLLWRRSGEGRTRRFFLRRGIAPMGGVLLATAAWMGYYFWRVTGSALRTPFQVNVATYNPVPYFPWMAMKAAPVYHHWVMQIFYLSWWARQYEFARVHPLLLFLLKNCMVWLFYFGPVLSVAVLMVGFVLPKRVSFRNVRGSTRFLLAVCGSVFLGVLLPVYFSVHYMAPVTAAFYALVLIALGNIRRWKPGGRPAGVAIVRSVPAVAVVMLVLCAASPALRNRDVPQLPTWYSPIEAPSFRAGIIAQLSAQAGEHLVLVHYRHDHLPVTEWVFNGADIDGAKIVWARDMNPEQNVELIRYFKNRQVWRLEADAVPPQLSAYPD